MDQRVGFIGLGDMGKPMARRVLGAGYQVTSSARRRRDAIDALKSFGLVEVASPFEVAKQSDVVITMVVDEAQSDVVLTGPDGALAGLAAGSVLVVMSTLSPEYCQSLAATAAQTGVSVLDCPVAGGRPRAEQGNLSLICGGPSETIEKCRPILEAMGKVFHCGSVGMGQVVKLANNGLVASQFRLVREVRAMSDAYGMNLSTLMEIIGCSTGTSWVLENWHFLEPHWGHLGPMAKKDLDLCLGAAGAKNVSTPLLDAAAKLSWA